MSWEKSFSCYFLWLDNDLNVTRTSLNLSHGFGGSDGKEAANKTAALVPLFQALSECYIIGYGTQVRFVQKGITGAGEAERRGNCVFTTADWYPFKTSIPGFNSTCCFDSGRDARINPDHPRVKRFIEAVLDGPLGAGNGCIASNGDSLKHFKEGYKYHRKSLTKRGRRQS